MSPEKQRIAIAKACGWTNIEDRSASLMVPCGFSVWGYHPSGAVIGAKVPLPPYLTDLNACAEMEKTLTDAQQEFYANKLLDPLWENIDRQPTTADIAWVALHSSAPQRCEAFLRSIGLWESDEQLAGWKPKEIKG